MDRKIYSIILASGKGERLNSSEKLPKQLLKLGSKTVLEVTLKQFLLISEIDCHILTVNEDWYSYITELLSPFLKEYPSLKIIKGDENRQGSLFKGLEFIQQEFGIGDKDIVLTHDAVRPFVFQEIIKEHISILIKGDFQGVNTVVKTFDTVVFSEAGLKIDEIPDRSKLFRGQTPQSFNLKILYDLLSPLTISEMSLLTDATSILHKNNFDVTLVEGNPYNMKVTLMEDLILANLLWHFLKNEENKEFLDGTLYL